MPTPHRRSAFRAINLRKRHNHNIQAPIKMNSDAEYSSMGIFEFLFGAIVAVVFCSGIIMFRTLMQ